MNSQQITINGLKVNYCLTGPEDGLPIVFIHGFPFDMTMWSGQIALLKDKYRCLAYDVRGHGGSEAGDGQYAIEFFVDDLCALLDHLKLDKVVLCGLSMGGYITLRLTEREPKRLKAMVLCDTRPEPDTNEGKLKRAEGVKRVKTQGLEAFADGQLPFMFRESTFSENPGVVKQARNMILRSSPLAVSGSLLAMAGRTNTTEMLSSIHVPVLCLVGEEDKVTTVEVMQHMAMKIPGVQLEIIPQAAHLSNLENPEVFNHHLKKFLDALS